MKVSLQPAFVLHQMAYRDSSLIIELLTRDYGRVGLVARGVKKSKSSLSATLQPFRRLLVSWSGKGELGTLVTAEADGSIAGLTGRIIMSGYYINELLLRLLHRHDPHPAIFSIYGDVLAILTEISQSLVPGRLNTSESDGDGMSRTLLEEERILRIFEKDLLGELGYGLVLDHDVHSNDPVVPGGCYHYYINRGPVVAAPGITMTYDGEDQQYGTEIRANNKRITITGQSLISFSKNDLRDAPALREIKGLMRAVVNEYLGGKPLRTRQLYRAFSLNKPALYQEVVQE